MIQKDSTGMVVKYSGIISIMLVLMMSVLNVTLVNVALPSFVAEFGISESSVVWIVTAYQLVITALLLPMSSVGDLYSYKRTFLVGVVVFTIASTLCGLSVNFVMLVTVRAVQGIGAACIMSVSAALVRMIYSPAYLGRGLALNAMVIAISTAAGPALAGVILSAFSWHWLFFINIPFGIAAFMIGLHRLPENRLPEQKEKFDRISAVENILSFALVFYALGNISRHGDMAASAVLLFSGVVIFFFYIRRQCDSILPMFPVDLFRNRVFSLSILTSVSSFISQSLAMIALPFLFINSYGLSEISTGLLMTPWPIATMILSPVIARYVEHHDPGLAASAGMVVYAAGVLMLISLPSGHVSEWDIAWRMVICGIGYGLFQTPNNIVMISATPIHRSGGAGGMQGTARLTGQTLGAILVTLLFSAGRGTSVSSVTCLWVAMAFAVVAALFSINRRRYR